MKKIGYVLMFISTILLALSVNHARLAIIEEIEALDIKMVYTAGEASFEMEDEALYKIIDAFNEHELTRNMFLEKQALTEEQFNEYKLIDGMGEIIEKLGSNSNENMFYVNERLSIVHLTSNTIVYYEATNYAKEGNFRLTIYDIDKKPVWSIDEENQSIQGELELLPGDYFIVNEFRNGKEIGVNYLLEFRNP